MLRSEKAKTTYIQELTKDDVRKMKDQLDHIDPEKLIKDALIADQESKDNQVHHKRSELLEQTRMSSISSYLESIKGKSVKEILNEFEKKIDEYNKGVQVIIDKTEKENIQYKSQANSLKEQNALLESNIAQMNIEHIKLEEQLKDSNNQIYKLQARFEIFNKNKELFDEFLKNFPDESPIDMMKDITARRNEAKTLLEELNDLQEKIRMIQKEKAESEKSSKKVIEELTHKYYLLENEKKGLEEKFEKKEIQIQNELSLYKDYQKENLLLHNMLFQIYNLLFDTLRLDKSIDIKDEYLNIQESDFNPNVFNNFEVCSYVKLMISSMTSTTSDKIYRECIAYANMMIRKYIPEKINLRYKPIEIFKEIKSLVEKKDEQLNKCQQDLNLYKEKIKLLEQENIKIKNKYINESQSFENFKKIVEKLLANNGITANIKEGSKKFSFGKADTNKKEDIENKTCTSPMNTRYSEYIHTTTAETKIPQLSLSKSKKKHRKSLQSGTSCKVGRKTEYANELYKRNLVQSKESLGKFDVTDRVKKKKEKISIISQDIVQKSNSDTSEDSVSVLNEEEAKEFRELKRSNQQDKLTKSHGCQNLITNLNGIRELVEHTNRIYMYKAKMHRTENKSKLDKLHHSIENRFISTESDIIHQEKNPFKDRALKKINNLIHKIQSEQKE